MLVSIQNIAVHIGKRKAYKVLTNIGSICSWYIDLSVVSKNSSAVNIIRQFCSTVRHHRSNDIMEFHGTLNRKKSTSSVTDVVGPLLSVNKSSWDVYKRKFGLPSKSDFLKCLCQKCPFLETQLSPFLNKDRQEDMRTLAETQKCVIMEAQQKLGTNIGYTSWLGIRHGLFFG